MSATAKDLLIRELKDMNHRYLQTIDVLQTSLKQSQDQVAELIVQIKLLNEQIEYLKRKLFGTSSEKKKVEELILSDTEPDEILTVEEIPVKSHTRKKKKSLEEKIKNFDKEI